MTLRRRLGIAAIALPVTTIPRFEGKHGHPVGCAAKLRVTIINPNTTPTNTIHRLDCFGNSSLFSEATTNRRNAIHARAAAGVSINAIRL